jgi:N-acyl homoserine lactone hydrolase
MNAEVPTPTVEVEVLHFGDITSPSAWIYRPRIRSALAAIRNLRSPVSASVQLPLLAFLIRHPSAGVIVIDTGLHPQAIQDLRGDYGLVSGLFFRTLRPVDGPFDEQLRSRGLDPEDITRVVMTHLHADHTSGMRLLRNARFICSGAEWTAATGPRPALAGYVASHLPAASRVELVDPERDGEPHDAFLKTIDLLGDGSVRLLWTPGHSAGHLSVLLQTAGRPVLLIGDAVYTMRSLREQLLPMRTVDDRLYLQSIQQIRRYAESHPDALLIPTHDQNAWRQLSGAAGSPGP